SAATANDLKNTLGFDTESKAYFRFDDDDLSIPLPNGGDVDLTTITLELQVWCDASAPDNTIHNGWITYDRFRLTGTLAESHAPDEQRPQESASSAADWSVHVQRGWARASEGIDFLSVATRINIFEQNIPASGSDPALAPAYLTTADQLGLDAKV